MRRVLITGGTGFIGSRLLARLAGEAIEVHAVSRTASGGGLARWWRVDLSDLTRTRELFGATKPDVVVHLASHVVGARTLDMVVPTFRDNLMAAVNLYVAATETGCSRVVVAGSLEEPRGEVAEAVPSSPYAAAKLGAGAYARMFNALYRLPVVILRLFMVYGPGQRDTRKLVPYTILSRLRGIAPSLSSGTRPVDWIYVEDVVTALILAATRPDVEGKTLDIGSGRLVTVREVVERIASLVPSPAEPVFGGAADRLHEQVRVADISGAEAALSWRPEVSLDAGLERTVAWYRERLALDPTM